MAVRFYKCISTKLSCLLYVCNGVFVQIGVEFELISTDGQRTPIVDCWIPVAVPFYKCIYTKLSCLL